MSEPENQALLPIAAISPEAAPLAPPDYPRTPELWLQLAGSYVVVGDRVRALLTLSFALYYTRSHPSVVAMLEELGVRRLPVLPLLDRNRRANILLGKLRHRLLGPKRVR